jgi:hypothetical protein
MKAKRTTLTALLLTAGLLTLPGLLRSADARIIVSARISSPHLSVRVSNAPMVRVAPPPPVRRVVRVETRRPAVRGRVVVVDGITKADRRIAHRLAKITGYSQHALLDYRRAGYTWNETARLLDIRRDELGAAMNQGSYHRWMRGEGAHCEYHLVRR